MPSWRTVNNRRRRPILELEDRIYNQQLDMIAREFGPDADCNLGWGVDGGTDYISVSTKVYVEDRPILTSVGYYKTGKIEHSWS